MSAPAPSVWTDGALDTMEAAAFLSVSDRLVRTIANQQAWPRKYQGTKVLYPRKAVLGYLESLPSEPPPSLRDKAERIGRCCKTT